MAKTKTKSSTKKTGKKTNKVSSSAKLTWLPKKTFTLEFSIPWNKVKTAYSGALESLAKEVKIEGFRQGKAPKELVEKSVDQGKLYGEVVNQLLPLSYAKAISQHKLKPATAPKIEIVKAEQNKAWEFKATSCELPEVKLGDYKTTAKAALAKDKIWTPEKGSPTKKEEKPELDQTQKYNLVAKALIDETKVDIPDILINSEKDRLLSKLLDQVQKLGLTIDQYATSAGKTIEQIKEEYQKTAENTLILELILQAIADDRKVKIDDKEIDKMIDTAGDDKIKKQMNTPSERAYIASVLRKQNVIDYLTSL